MKSSLAMSSFCHAAWNLGGDRVGERLGREAGGLGGLGDLQAVLVGAGEERDLLAQQAVPARSSASPTIVV